VRRRYFGYFFRRRLALATARRRQGANSEAVETLPPREKSSNPETAAASIFSSSIRLYSLAEHLFCAISRVRRVNVSHDANIKSVMIIGRDVFRRLRSFITNGLLHDKCCETGLKLYTGGDSQELAWIQNGRMRLDPQRT
jgi:hypothetical protein